MIVRTIEIPLVLGNYCCRCHGMNNKLAKLLCILIDRKKHKDAKLLNIVTLAEANGNCFYII